MRTFKLHKGQRHLPGLWWSSMLGGHIGYESWLERGHVMLLDFDPAVVGISSQPFWLFWASKEGRGVSHAPDCFAAGTMAAWAALCFEGRQGAVGGAWVVVGQASPGPPGMGFHTSPAACCRVFRRRG
ncbi:hypothetical protein ACFU99_12090 [Streptomyces sp. NPDC057654]|uniref:hypothetical protein n=1 Tax=Streptomyces sp. NPDC057654 TaxID=3346196 RepID=UPI00367A27CE